MMLKTVLGALLSLFCFPAWALDIADFGGFPDGSDTTPAFNAAVLAAQAGEDKTIYFLAGDYSFQTAPDPVPGFMRFFGQGKGRTRLVRDYSGDFITIHGNSVTVAELTIYAGVGTSGGRGLHMIASDALGAGGNHRIVGVWITGMGTWAIPIFLDGINRTIAPIGLRTVRLDDVTVFNATFWAADFWNCIACEWIGGGAYQGYGTTQRIAVGGALGQKNRIDADIDWAASTVWAGQMRGPGK